MRHDGRTISHEALETYRFAAVELKKSGVPINIISNSFNVTERAVYRWLRKSKTEGTKSLKPKNSTDQLC